MIFKQVFEILLIPFNNFFVKNNLYVMLRAILIFKINIFLYTYSKYFNCNNIRKCPEIIYNFGLENIRLQ